MKNETILFMFHLIHSPPPADFSYRRHLPHLREDRLFRPALRPALPQDQDRPVLHRSRPRQLQHREGESAH